MSFIFNSIDFFGESTPSALLGDIAPIAL